MTTERGREALKDVKSSDGQAKIVPERILSSNRRQTLFQTMSISRQLEVPYFMLKVGY